MGLSDLSQVIGVDATALLQLLPPDVIAIDHREGAFTASSGGNDVTGLATGDPVEVLSATRFASTWLLRHVCDQRARAGDAIAAFAKAARSHQGLSTGSPITYRR